MDQQRKISFPDNGFREIPEGYFAPCDRGGCVQTIQYQTKDYHGCGEAFDKAAMVYLPHGYEEGTAERYDVLYFMHGGGGSERDFFVHLEVRFKELLDQMIFRGELAPCIVVTPSYNNPFNGNATECCKYFARELVEDLIPAVEGRYRTFAETTDRAGLRDSRLHRAFGGFSMGAACTWWVFEFALDEVGYFLPVSGDSWNKTNFKAGAGTAEYLRDCVLRTVWTKDDFFIYSGTGTNDIACPNMTPLIEEMKKLSEVFVYCDNFRDGNLYYCLWQDGWHNMDTIYRIVYNGLPKLFG